MATMLVFVLLDRESGERVPLDVLPEGFTLGEPIPNDRVFEFVGTVASNYDWTVADSAIQEIGKLGGDGDYLVVTAKGSTVLVRVASSTVYHEEDIERPEPEADVAQPVTTEFGDWVRRGPDDSRGAPRVEAV